MRFGTRPWLCAMALLLTNCKQRSENSLTAGTMGSATSGPTEKYLCEGERPTKAELAGSAHSRLVLQRLGQRLFVKDVSMPWRGDAAFQMSLSPVTPSPSYGPDALKATFTDTPPKLMSYKADCNHWEKGNKQIPAWSKACRSWEGDMMLLSEASLFQQSPASIYFGRPTAGPATAQINSFEFLIPYQCQAFRDDQDKGLNEIDTLREYFSLRNHVYRPYYRADWLGAQTNATTESSNEAVGLLQESIYQLKATRTLAGLPPRRNFFATVTHRDYHEKRDDLNSFKITRQQYGFLSKDFAIKAFEAATQEFETTYAAVFNPVYKTLPDGQRITNADVSKAFTALANNQQRFAIGTFNYRDSDCSRNASVIVVVDKEAKTAYPLIVPVCPP